MRSTELLTGTLAPQKPYPGVTPKYSFKITNGEYDHPELTNTLPDKLAAHREGLARFADLARSIAKDMQPNSEWQMEIADESGKPIYRLRLLSESLE
jgi:hypothetical protein